MQRAASEYPFSQKEAEEFRNKKRAENRNRTTPVYPCELRAREKRRESAKKRKVKRPKGDLYTPDSYRRAIEYGVAKANRILSKTKPDFSLLPSWTPYQLRHMYATEMRKNHGVDAVQNLGHARMNIVDVYAEKNRRLVVRGQSLLVLSVYAFGKGKLLHMKSLPNLTIVGSLVSKEILKTVLKQISVQLSRRREKL